MKNTFWSDFGKDGNTYQMGPQPQRLKILDLLDKYDCKSVLDVGCGTGPMYEIIRDHGIPIDYKGVDYSDTFIETCKREFPNGNWEVQDARKLSDPDNSFDAVVLLHALDHIDDYKSVFRSAARVAKKIAIIILWRPFVGFGSGNNLNSVNKDFEDTHLQDYDKKKLDKAILDNGFNILSEFEFMTPKYNYFYVLEPYD